MVERYSQVDSKPKTNEPFALHMVAILDLQQYIKSYDNAVGESDGIDDRLKPTNHNAYHVQFKQGFRQVIALLKRTQ